MSTSIIGTIVLTGIVVLYIIISWTIRARARRSALKNQEENPDT